MKLKKDVNVDTLKVHSYDEKDGVYVTAVVDSKEEGFDLNENVELTKEEAELVLKKIDERQKEFIEEYKKDYEGAKKLLASLVKNKR